MIDVAIVGGGPAGLSTALHLRAVAPSLRVVVLEKERYPREKFCAGGVGQRAFRLLEQIDVRPEVPRVPFGAVAIRFPDRLLEVREPNFGAVVRRIEFDHALAREAVRRGVDLREGAQVRSVEAGPDAVQVRLASDEVVRARVVVGADGVGGVVRRSMGLDGGTLRAQVIECDTEPVDGDFPRDTLFFDASDPRMQGYGWDFPTLVDGQARVCRGVYIVRQFGPENVHERLRAYLLARGLRMEGYRLKPFAERGFDHAGRLSSPRVLLAGEAAGIDIATGEGIAQAIQYGELAARYLGRAFDKRRFDFEDWRRVVQTARVGRSLMLRTLIFRTMYFQRDRTAKLLAEHPAILRAFAEDFALGAYRSRTLARLAWGMPRGDLRWILGVVAGIVEESLAAPR